MPLGVNIPIVVTSREKPDTYDSRTLPTGELVAAVLIGQGNIKPIRNLYTAKRFAICVVNMSCIHILLLSVTRNYIITSQKMQ